MKHYTNTAERKSFRTSDDDPTSHDGSRTNHDGKGVDVFTSNFDFLPASHLVRTLSVARLKRENDVAARGDAFHSEVAFVIRRGLQFNPDVLAWSLHLQPRVLCRTIGTYDAPCDLD